MSDIKKWGLFLGTLAVFAALIFVLKPTQINKLPNSTPVVESQTSESVQSESTAMTNQTPLPQPEVTINKSKTYIATLKTDQGQIVIELNANKTPITVNNFVYLANKGFYNNTIFHRVIKGFMIQGGDPEGTGMGGPGYEFDDEPFEGKYTRGTIAMANAGPDTNGSQFFIMHQDYDLPPNYIIFGKVTSGMEVVDKIAEAEVKTNTFGEPSTPVTPVKVNSIEITEK